MTKVCFFKPRSREEVLEWAPNATLYNDYVRGVKTYDGDGCKVNQLPLHDVILFGFCTAQSKLILLMQLKNLILTRQFCM